MSLQAAVDGTSRYIRSKEASLARLMEELSPPDERRHRLVAGLSAAIAAAKRRRIAFGLGLKVKK
jgi:hypothetical protein